MPKWDGISEPVGEITALKRQEYREIAQETLEKVYRYVLPIMKKRNYRVHKLCEFLPKTQNLLGVNVNHGQRINLRLRYHHNPREFLPFESVLGTMLHELCHNTFGPHNQQFFALLDELTQEMESLLAQGFKGDPFIGSGQMVGGRPLSASFVGNNMQGSRILRGSGSGSGSAGTAGAWAVTGLNTKPSPYTSKPKPRSGRKLGGLGQAPARDAASKRELLLRAAERRRLADLACRSVDRQQDLPQDEGGGVIDLTAEDADEAVASKPGPKVAEDATESPETEGSGTTTRVDPDVIYILD